jgi:hypothetical protein
MEGCRVRHGTWPADTSEPAAAGANCLRPSRPYRYAARGHSVSVVSLAQWYGGAWSRACGREWYMRHGNTARPIAIQSARPGQG